jgi:hypothetical protein
VQPDSNLNVIVFVAIFSAVVSTPIAFTLDRIIQHVLAAPTFDFQKNRLFAIVPSTTVNTFSHNANSTSVLVRSRRKADIHLSNLSNAVQQMSKLAQVEFEDLTIKLKAYRMTLPDKHEFDCKLSDQSHCFISNLLLLLRSYMGPKLVWRVSSHSK